MFFLFILLLVLIHSSILVWIPILIFGLIRILLLMAIRILIHLFLPPFSQQFLRLMLRVLSLFPHISAHFDPYFCPCV